MGMAAPAIIALVAGAVFVIATKSSEMEKEKATYAKEQGSVAKSNINSNVHKLESAKLNYYSVYGKTPTDIAELQTKGFISSGWDGGKYAGQLTISSSGETLFKNSASTELKDMEKKMAIASSQMQKAIALKNVTKSIKSAVNLKSNTEVLTSVAMDYDSSVKTALQERARYLDATLVSSELKTQLSGSALASKTTVPNGGLQNIITANASTTAIASPAITTTPSESPSMLASTTATNSGTLFNMTRNMQ